MKIGSVRKSLAAISIVIGATILFGLGAFSAKAYLTRHPGPSQNANTAKNTNNPFLTEGFDFKRLRAADNEWRGPEIGEKIDLSRFRAKDGEPLNSTTGKRPIMIVAVNPDCGMCTVASDEMSHLREKLSTMDIKYFIVSVTPQTTQVDFFKYSDSLNAGAPGYLWNAGAGAPPESLSMMTTPAHLLLNEDGTVIRVWPGSHQDRTVRQRMARQIIADTLVATDTLNAIAHQNSGAPQVNLARR